MQTATRKVITMAIVAAGLVSPVVAIADHVSTDPQLKADLAVVVATESVASVDGLTTAGQPSAAALEVFADSGYATVIDLRTPGENRGFDEQATVESLGMEYVNLPIAGAKGISFENAAALQSLINDSEGPVLLHCGSANRVGALLALQKSAEGADAAEAMAFGREAGMSSLSKIVEAAIKDN